MVSSCTCGGGGASSGGGGGGESQPALSVHHTGHHTRALWRRWSENGSCVPIRALLLMAQLVVVRSESATAVVARVRLFS